MTYSLLIILIIIAIIIYNNLNKKISDLERKISELNERISAKNGEAFQTIEEESLPVINIPSENKSENILSPKQPVAQEQLSVSPQKDWLSPVFDFLKQNALSIIGIFTLVMGIGYFVKYAIDKNWIGETARAGIGIIAGVGIMITGHFLRKNYAVFSSIITGGGIAILYFTITIAFREYHLFNQNVAFAIICCITLISIFLSYYYKREVLIIFSLFGGFLAPLMISTGQSNYPFLFTYLTVLNIGMLIVVFLKHWKSVGWISFVFTMMYLFYWTLEDTDILSTCFYIITYIIFYAFALQDYIKKNILSASDILMLVLINFSSIIGLVYIFNELEYEPASIFPAIFAVVNGVLLYREYNRKNFGTYYSVFAGITISLITLALALQFKTNLLTSVWAVEATLLLFLWKKTNLNIFKICFYILFPLVIIAQIITWTGYFDQKNLSVVFNPIFLTSSVTVITTFANLILLRKLSTNHKSETSFFGNIFIILSYGVIYSALLFEIIYHISEKPSAIIICIGLLFSIYYVFILLLGRRKLSISKSFEIVLIYVFLFLIILHSTVSGSEVVNGILNKKIDQSFYFISILYGISLMFSGWKILPGSDFFNHKTAYWFLSLTLVIVMSMELYHFYILGNAQHISEIYDLQERFSILYLPIIWAVLASVFIYTGLKKNISELSKIGFTLIAVMILKLYAYDVWQMDNISRIVAFIILGIILLLSSFTFQRLKNIIKNMVDQKEESSENENSGLH